MRKILALLLFGLLIILFIAIKINLFDQKKDVVQFDAENIEDLKNTKQSSSSAEVALPSGEHIVRLFFSLINDGRIPEAIDMLSLKAAADDSSRQSWGVQFNHIKSVQTTNIEPISQETWTDTKKIYKVMLEIYVDAKAADTPIPFYGWQDNPNIRFITIVKNDEGLWKIDQIGTGL